MSDLLSKAQCHKIESRHEELLRENTNKDPEFTRKLLNSTENAEDMARGKTQDFIKWYATDEGYRFFWTWTYRTMKSEYEFDLLQTRKKVTRKRRY